MNPEDYRARAQRCREAAAQASDRVKDDFLVAAATWDQLASQAERLKTREAAPEASAARQDRPAASVIVYYVSSR
jgi:hypothetical protein